MEPTEPRLLGKTNVTVTALGLGGAPLGGLFSAVRDDEAHRVIRRAFDLGLRLFDTAPQYGHGRSESRFGQVLGRLPREQFTLATKIGRLLRPDGPPVEHSNWVDPPPVNPVYDFSYEGALRSHEESLARLGLERVDIVHIHDPDADPAVPPARHFRTAVEGAFRALDRLRRQGTIGAIGAGMNQAEMLARFARAADFDCFLLAGRYTLLDQIALRELLPLCVKRNIAIIIGGVYNSGILANPEPGSTFNYRPAEQAWLDKAQRIKDICDRHAVPLKAAAIQFPLAHPAVATVLTGARSVRELDENLAMMRYPIPTDLWQELKAVGLLPVEAPVPGV
jgi:D-threo-aldose 1-dehydrogenase